MKRRSLAIPLVLVALVSCSASSSPQNLADAGDGGGQSDGPSDVGFPPEGGQGCFVRPTCATCYAGSHVCCISPNPSPPPGYDVTCMPCPMGFGSVFVTLACGSEADCKGGQVCCLQKDMMKNVQSVCAPSCDPSQRQFQLCDPAATTTACPASAVCSNASSAAWSLPRCYGTCGGALPPP